MPVVSSRAQHCVLLSSAQHSDDAFYGGAHIGLPPAHSLDLNASLGLPRLPHSPGVPSRHSRFPPGAALYFVSAYLCHCFICVFLPQSVILACHIPKTKHIA